MPFKFEIDRKYKIFRCQLYGRITDQDLREFYLLASKHAAKLNPHAGLTDFSGVTALDVSPQTARELAGFAPVMPDPKRVRVVVAPTDLEFGIARVFELEGRDTRPNLHIVRTLQEAWVLLGVRELDARFQGL
jgi:hypothetical protein